MFINQFMNQAAAHLANREELWFVELYKGEGGWSRNYQQKKRKDYLSTKEKNLRIVSGNVTFP